jgi:MFS family permease
VTVGSILGLLGSTPLLHRLGGRRAIRAALLLIAAAMTLLGVALIAGSLPLAAFGFVTAGTGIGALDVLINVAGAAVERVAGRTLMPRMHAAWSVGAAVGSGIGAACAALGISPAEQLNRSQPAYRKSLERNPRSRCRIGAEVFVAGVRGRPRGAPRTTGDDP